MQIYIDQSGRVEFTSHPTVVAYSNGKSSSIYISAKEKRVIQQLFRKAGKPTMFTFRTFAVLIYLLIRSDLSSIKSIIIDREYKGQDDLIKKYLLELIQRGGNDFDPDSVHFMEIGKENNAHKKAITVFRENAKPVRVVRKEDLLEWLL